MTERSRTQLQTAFANGQRPSEDDFANLFDSFLNISDDHLSVDSDDLVLQGGLALGDSSRAQAGTLRLNGGNVQFHDGTSWVNLGAGGGGGAFQSAGTSGEVAYAGGNVGIGAAFAGTSPTFALDVDLDENTDTGDRVRFGTVVCSRGTGATGGDAFVYQRDQDPAAGYALRQRANGEVFLNAPANRRLRIGQDGSVTPAVGIATNGNVVVGNADNLPGGTGHRLQVNGTAAKNAGGATWDVLSDARVKEDVRDLEFGLSQLLAVRPVRFRFNGRAGTPAGREEVGIIGQEIEAVFPEMVERVRGALDAGGEERDDLRMYNASALTYVLVNAVKELAAKVERLEAILEGGRDGDG